MIRKSGHRFCDKIMRKQKLERAFDSIKGDNALAVEVEESATTICVARMMQRQAVVDMAAVVEAAAIAEAMLDNDGVSAMVHEVCGQTPAALIEVACGAVVMPRIGHMAPVRQAADVAGLVAGRHEVGDHRLEAVGEMAGDRDLPRGGVHSYHSVARGGALLVPLVLFRVPAPQGANLGGPIRPVSGLPMVVSVMMGVVLLVMTMMMTMCGLRRD